jgi:type III restriction enzyme
LQRDIRDSLSERPRKADEAYFTGKVLKTDGGDVKVTPEMARAIYRYVLKNDYIDNSAGITTGYHEAKRDGTLAALPADLAPHAAQVFRLIDGVYSDADLPGVEDERKAKVNPLNANFEKKEFQALWSRINRKAAYTVHFETPELLKKCISAIDTELKVSPLLYTVQRGEQTDTASYDAVKQGEAFRLQTTATEALKASVQSSVKYDLIGKLTAETQLTRSTIGRILQGVNIAVFSQYRTNPEDFMRLAARLINEQKATVIVEHLAYNPAEDAHSLDIFTREKPKEDFSRALKTERHIYDYVFTDSATERKFVRELDTGTEVVVYAKLPKSFFIPTPVGNYNPDWAIAFQEGAVKHVYFIAETKGSLSSMELRKIEECKIDCARKFFGKITSGQVKYDVVDSYARLMELVK